MRFLRYVSIGCKIFLTAIVILIGVHWAEVSALLTAAGTQLLSSGLKLAVLLAGIALMLGGVR